MRHIHSFEVNDTLVEDLLKLVGRQSKSNVIRDALKFYYEHIQKGKHWSPTMLPNPRIFESQLRTAAPHEVEFYVCETSRLYNIAKLVESTKKLIGESQ